MRELIADFLSEFFGYKDEALVSTLQTRINTYLKNVPCEDPDFLSQYFDLEKENMNE